MASRAVEVNVGDVARKHIAELTAERDKALDAARMLRAAARDLLRVDYQDVIGAHSLLVEAIEATAWVDAVEGAT